MFKMFKILVLLLLMLLLVSCRSAKLFEQVTVREREVNNSFSLWGLSSRDTLSDKLYVLDTLLNCGRLRTSFDELSKIQGVEFVSNPIILSDTIRIKTETEVAEVLPSWIKILVGILVGIIIMCVLLYRIKK